jgi:aspartyl-tRNA(Asn)/glutamyl-tRNA(Gln) amidotransferase subunit C
MSLLPEDVRRLGELARIHFEPAEQAQLLDQLNRVFDVIEALRVVDTTGVEPMTHPQADPLRQRDDVVTERDLRAENQQGAPAVAEGLYLVPRVVE